MRLDSVKRLSFILLCLTPGFAQVVPYREKITYLLPYTGETTAYSVTLAAAPQNEPDQLISTFVAGAIRRVDEKNKGVFTETWDGLDDNFMPVPSGKYVIKGIYAPAKKWKIDGQYHVLTP